jgi:hypothetical protein
MALTATSSRPGLTVGEGALAAHQRRRMWRASLAAENESRKRTRKRKMRGAAWRRSGAAKAAPESVGIVALAVINES